jgi:hypothetical protein
MSGGCFDFSALKKEDEPMEAILAALPRLTFDELKALDQAVTQELRSRWQLYAQRPELFAAAVNCWDTERLRTFVLQERYFGDAVPQRERRLYAIAGAELERREPREALEPCPF